MRYIFLILTITTLQAGAQSDAEGVKQTITRFFDGMRQSDTGLIRSTLAPAALLQTVAKTKEGKTMVQSDDINRFIQFVAQPHPEVYDERISFEVVKTDGDLAMAWTPYRFYVGEKFSHCGVNSFQLVRLNGAWKIQYIIDTRRKECGESRESLESQ